MKTTILPAEISMQAIATLSLKSSLTTLAGLPKSPLSLPQSPLTSPKSPFVPLPTMTTFDPLFTGGKFITGGSIPTLPNHKVGTQYEKVNYTGPGEAIYVPAPTRSQLKKNNHMFGSAYRPYYYRDPHNIPYIDIDGRDCGPRWIYVDPRGFKKDQSNFSRKKAIDETESIEMVNLGEDRCETAMSMRSSAPLLKRAPSLRWFGKRKPIPSCI